MPNEPNPLPVQTLFLHSAKRFGRSKPMTVLLGQLMDSPQNETGRQIERTKVHIRPME